MSKRKARFLIGMRLLGFVAWGFGAGLFLTRPIWTVACIAIGEILWHYVDDEIDYMARKAAGVPLKKDGGPPKLK